MLIGAQILALIVANLNFNEVFTLLGDDLACVEVSLPLLQEKQMTEVWARWFEVRFANKGTHVFHSASVRKKLEVLMWLVGLFTETCFEGFKSFLVLRACFLLLFFAQFEQIVRFQRLVERIHDFRTRTSKHPQVLD